MNEIKEKLDKLIIELKKSNKNLKILNSSLNGIHEKLDEIHRGIING